MLFKTEHVIPIILKVKTETRRDWKETYNKPIVGRTHQARTKMIGKPYFALIDILEIFQEKLGDISYESALREGYPNQHEYIKAFFRINNISQQNRAIYLSKEVWVVRFELVEGSIVWEVVEQLIGIPREEIIKMNINNVYSSITEWTNRNIYLTRKRIRNEF